MLMFMDEKARPPVGMIKHSVNRSAPPKRTNIIIRPVTTREDWTDFMSIYIQCYPDREVRPQTIHWTGYINGIPVACVSARRNNYRGIVFDLGTAPGFRGNGYGHDMTRHACVYLRDAGCKYVHASINEISERIAHVLIGEINGGTSRE
jgi:GNAT superfamily N-acetyltransferase